MSTIIERFTCPRCAGVLTDAMDRRFGYCPTCVDFTVDPTNFLIQSELSDAEREAWTKRVRAVSYRHMVERGPYPILTEEEREAMWARNVATIRYEERIALTVARPQSFPRPDGSHTPRSFLWWLGWRLRINRWRLINRWRQFTGWAEWVIYGAGGRPTKR